MSRYRDPLTKDLFSWEPPKVAVGYSNDVIGRGRLDNKIARIIGQALRDARDDGLRRSDVASGISAFLNRPISEAMLNKWSSEGSEDHRVPLDAFIGLVRVTGARDALGFVPGEFGLSVIENEYADLIEHRLLEEQVKKLRARQQVLDVRWGTKR